MNIKNVKEKTLALIRKVGKKTVIATMAVIVIGVAVLLNFLVTRQTPVELEEELGPVAALLTDGEVEVSADEYFATVTLNRRTARDEAMAVLKTVTESDSAVEEVKNSAYGDIRQIAGDIEREANIESLVAAKGFEQCVAVVNGDTASIIVKCDGLTPGEVAQISEIVYNETGIAPADLKIIEKK
ncbi:MAG: SpoIIIAH-like family protein [Clostridia bacterium]|nr:SpoIIIAH-like family protein [Clostridia bacterium]